MDLFDELLNVVDDGINQDWDGYVPITHSENEGPEIVTDRYGYEFMLKRVK